MGLEELGYLGLFIAGFLAATILPFSSESLLAVALLNGFDPIICLIIITSGNWIGSITTYGIGYLGKIDWIENYFKISREKIEKTKSYLIKYGTLLALFAWVPIIGDVFALTLGYFKINFILTALFMLIGKFFRYLLIVFLFN
jgi:membrane protein YqaA with SNARE-associated domain|tara:strand:- start:1092 stop:1520 length:429 start_codon:yes stop_codon:yes gene_type:complete